MELSGAHVLVVGATGGLGAPLSRALAAAGARLSLSGRNGDLLGPLAAEVDAVSATVADLVDPTAPTRIVAAAVAAGGPLDALVTAAGIVAFGPLGELDDDVLDEVLLVDLIAPIRLLREASSHLRRGGVVVNLSAVVADTPLPGMAVYSAAKAGLTAFDKAAARELRRVGVRVLDVRPPHTETELAQHPVAGTAPKLGAGKQPADVVARIVRAIREDETDLPADAF